MSLLIVLSAILLQCSIQRTEPQRNILLFGNKEAPAVKQQLEYLQMENCGLAERDIKLTMIQPGGVEYQTFSVSPLEPFMIILVGRDGEEKYRSNRVTTTFHLFALIDAMPMRKAEMRKQKNHQP